MALDLYSERPFYDEEVKLCKEWAEEGFTVDLDEYIHSHGTPEYIEYYDQGLKELEELHRQSPDEMW